MVFLSVSNTDSGNESLNPTDLNFNDEDWQTIVRKRWSNLTPLLRIASVVSNPLKNIKRSWSIGLTLERYTYLSSSASGTSLSVNSANGIVAGDTILVGGVGGTFTVVTAVSGTTLTVEDSVTASAGETVVNIGAAQIPGATPDNWSVEEVTEAYNYMQEYNRLLNVAEATMPKMQYYGMNNEQAIVMGMLQTAAVDMDRTLMLGERQAAANASTIPMAGGIRYLLNTYASGNVATGAGATKWSDISGDIELIQSQGGFPNKRGILVCNTKGNEGIHKLLVLNNASADVWQAGSPEVPLRVNINGVLFDVIVDPHLDAAGRSGTARTRTAFFYYLSPTDAGGNPNIRLIFDGVSPQDYVRIQRYDNHASADDLEIYTRFTLELGEPQMHGAREGITSFAAES